MKTGFFTAALAMLALAASQTFAQGLLRPDNKRVLGTNNIIAVVEDRVITRAEVMKEVEPFIPQIRAAARSEFEFTSRVNAYVREIVQNMVDRELIVKEFKAKGMTIPQSYLDTHFDDYLNREFNGDRAEFVKFVQAQGKTIKQFRAEQEKDIIVGYMQGQKRQTVSEISPAKIKEYYEANKSKWYSPASVKSGLLPSKRACMQASTKTASSPAEIVERLKKGEDFAELAKRFSKDDSSTKGGDWGWYKRANSTPFSTARYLLSKSARLQSPRK